MKNKIKVLFVCIHNSARSQMAETFLNHYGSEHFSAESAGLEPGKLNPNVVEVMREKGFDISGNQTKSVLDFLNNGYDFVVTVCDEASAEKCPVFPGNSTRLHWGFRDPSSLTGSSEDVMHYTRIIRDEIESKVREFAEKN
jgi:arsenate reductase (thioredoxin)